MKDYGFIGNILVYGLSGAFGFSLLFVLGTWLFAPQAFGDGQYAMTFMLTFPFGWVIGSVIGANRAEKNQDAPTPRKTSLLGLGIVAAGCITLPILGTMFMIIFFGFIGLVIETLRR